MAENGLGYTPYTGYGQALLQRVENAVGPTMGRVMLVFNSSDTNLDKMRRIFKPFQGRVRIFTSLETALAAVDSNANDTLCLEAQGSHSIDDGLDMSSINRTNLLGMDGGGRMLQQGAKISLATASTSAYVLKNTGTRNSLRNIKLIQNATAATALHVGELGGEGNLYKNVSFTFGVADNLDLTTATEVLIGEDSATFDQCTFGQDTLLSSATARSIMTIDQVKASQEFKSNFMRDCTWIGASSDADLQAISMAAAGDILFTNEILRPTFIASIDSRGGIACTKAVSTANGNVKGTILISEPKVHGFNDVGINGTNNDGLFVFSHVPSAVNITSAKPTTV